MQAKWLFVCLLCCFHIMVSAQKQKPNAANGGVFTPKGTLRALIVFVTYKDNSKANPSFKNTEQSFSDWKITEENRLPDFVDPHTGECPTYIFNKASHFDTHLDQVKNNFSKTFYLMSNGQFRLIGELFKDKEGKPIAIEVDPTGGFGWTGMNKRAMQEMQRINPNFDFSRFDQRKNSPNFLFDNSDTDAHGPDGIIDFVVFVHRYSGRWSQAPTKGMRSWVGSGGGFAGTGIPANERVGKYRIAEGFTMTYQSGVFVHEVAHVLFNAPHIMGVNNVIGDYFDLQNAGWGIMAPISIFSGFNAWERWYSGFIEPVVTIQNKEDLKTANNFVLRDYYTTGDAARIAIPFSGGQYLWLENHQKRHPQDEHPWAGRDLGNGDILAPSAKGIYAYVEDIAGTRNEIFSPLSYRANGIKVLHAGGNYDYYLHEELPVLRNAWNNPLYSFTREEANPIGGTNNFYRYVWDENKDGTIKLDPNYNASKTEYRIPILREEIAPDSFVNLYGGFGVYDTSKANGYVSTVAFQAGDYLDVSTNPMPLNYPKYNRKKATLEPYYLNGLGVKFLPIANSEDIKVQVTYDQVQLCQDARWTGNITLPNITEDNAADLEIGPCVQLIINKSKTVNRHLRTENGDFVNATSLRVEKNATLIIKSNSKVLLEDDSQLIIEKGGKLVLEKKAKLIVGKNAILSVDKEDLQQKAKSKIVYR